MFSSEAALKQHQQFLLLYFLQVFQDLSTARTRISASNFSSIWGKKDKSKNNIQFCTYKHNLGNITISGYLKTSSLHTVASIKNAELQYLKLASTFTTVDSCWPQISNTDNYWFHCQKYYKRVIYYYKHLIATLSMIQQLQKKLWTNIQNIFWHLLKTSMFSLKTRCRLIFAALLMNYRTTTNTKI